ncbi:MAG: ammonia-forming cytochrome c nitrite reductase subunit c552 [Pirellulales bacterium]|nr:ammonia-forming cytochrome c nitrite reductase subunit c552 [Pirellulales bacterium]
MTDPSRPDNPASRSGAATTARWTWLGWFTFAVVTVAVFFLGLLFASVLERRDEARIRPPIVPIDALETDSSRWAANWPRQYASYKRMADDTTRTKYGGAAPRDYLEETPANVVLFAGYGFAKDYRQARGHTWAIDDVTQTARIAPTTPATCWTCKGPDVPRMMVELAQAKAGARDEGGKVSGENSKLDDAAFERLILAGAGDFYGHGFADFKDEITHPIGCLDCHEPQTMRLRITRPALIEAFERQGRDIHDVSHQEMRTLVCAQCHVEYYFKKEGDYLAFPWDKGTSVEAIGEYYDEAQFSDWTHAISKAPMVKMQHPDYEMYRTGIHAYRDVACADCHMPYRTEGGVKYTDHHLQSPLLNVANSCAVCHRWSEAEIVARATGIQDKVREGRDRAERTIARAHFDVAACIETGATDEQLGDVRRLVREAQLRWDYVAANNGMGFHSPAESLRILAAAVELAEECRLTCARLLARKGHAEPVAYPDCSTKEKAQAVLKQYLDGKPPKLLGSAATQ